MRAWAHPMRHLVRHVFPDGSSVVTQMAWQRPLPGLEITTKFHDVDKLNGSEDSAKAAAAVVGQRARFRNRFRQLEDSVGVTGPTKPLSNDTSDHEE